MRLNKKNFFAYEKDIAFKKMQFWVEENKNIKIINIEYEWGEYILYYEDIS